MNRSLSHASAFLVSALFLSACPSEEPGLDGGVADAGVDAGSNEVDAGPTGCGDVTPEGTCQGDLVVFCDASTDEVITFDCGDRSLFPEASTQCVEVTADYGVDCTVAPGDACAFFTEDGEFVWTLCRGEQPACLETEDAFACIENAGTCEDSDIGTCDGDTLVWSCAASQPFLIDCATYGGTCSAEGLGACVGLPVGAICDEELYQCAPGLDCRVGECVTLDVDDAGPSPADAGSTSEDAGESDAG